MTLTMDDDGTPLFNSLVSELAEPVLAECAGCSTRVEFGIMVPACVTCVAGTRVTRVSRVSPWVALTAAQRLTVARTGLVHADVFTTDLTAALNGRSLGTLRG